MMTRKHVNKRTLFAGTIATLAVATFGAWFVYSSDAATPPPAPPVPQVVVSTPLERQVDSRLSFLGQFSAIERVELRAQVGGTLTGVYFKDGDIVHKGDLLFTSMRGLTRSDWHRPKRSSRQRPHALRSPSASSIVPRFW